jgi:RNA polymerase sigma-70 factor, ECF subfamily
VEAQITAAALSRPEGTRVEDVYRQESPRLLVLATLLTGDRAAAQDLAHDVFVAVLEQTRRDAAYLREPAWPWLRVTATRMALRRRRRIAGELVRLARIGATLSEPDWPATTVDLVAAFRVLPARMRACAGLFYGEDMSAREVAATLGISERTVENQLRAARRRLAHRLGEEA